MPEHHAACSCGPLSLVAPGDPGAAIHVHSCPRCGAMVWYGFDPASRAVPVGASARPKFDAPSVSICEERRRPRVSVPASARRIF